QRPVGLGPYRFVSGTPGVELTLEASASYWRKRPSIKRLLFKGVPERSTRLAMLKTGEADIGYLMIGDEAVAIQSDPQLRLAEAGYPHGFDAGDITPTPPFTTFAESVGNYLGAVGIRVRVRSMERAAFLAAWREKKLQGIIAGSSAALGNAAPGGFCRQYGH